MSLFSTKPTKPRIAAFVNYEFPSANDEPVYQQLEDQAAALGAELRIVHTVVADPNDVPATQRARFGTGLFVPMDARIHANDVEHFRRQPGGIRDRFDELVDSLKTMAQASRAMVIVRPEFQKACSIARWLRGWAPDLIVSFGRGEGSMQAMICAHLLDVERMLAIDSLDGDAGAFALLLPLHLQQCALLVTADDGVRQQLTHHHPDTADKWFAPSDAALLPAIRALLRQPRSAKAPALGPAAAFRTRREAAPKAPVRPLLILGAERTGSNMLVAMLTKQHAVACAGELFNPRRIDEQVLDWLQPPPAERDELLALRRRSPAELHARLLRDGQASGAAVTGYKLLYYHGMVDDRVADHLAADSATENEPLHVVHLTRRQRLRRWLSLSRANASDQWFAQHGSKPTGEQPAQPLDARATVTDFTMAEQFEDRYRALLAHCPMLELDYGDLAHRLPATTARLAQFLDVPLGELRPSSRKTGARDLRQAIANFDELRAALAGTRWSQLADEVDADE